MKKLAQFTTIVLLFIFAACAPSKEDAIKHNDTIVADQKEILALEDNLIGSIAEWNYAFAASDLKEYQVKLGEYINKYEKMKAFDKDDGFRLSMLQLLKDLKQQADGNYLLVLEIMTVTETMDELDDENYNALLDILDDIDMKSDAANNQFLDAQKKFAEKYDLQLK